MICVDVVPADDAYRCNCSQCIQLMIAMTIQIGIPGELWPCHASELFTILRRASRSSQPATGSRPRWRIRVRPLDGMLRSSNRPCTAFRSFGSPGRQKFGAELPAKGKPVPMSTYLDAELARSPGVPIAEPCHLLLHKGNLEQVVSYLLGCANMESGYLTCPRR